MKQIALKLAFIPFSLFVAMGGSLAFADEAISLTSEDNTAAVNNNQLGCIPEVALPVYPESNNCVAMYLLELPDYLYVNSAAVSTSSKQATVVVTEPTAVYYTAPEVVYVPTVYSYSIVPVYGAFATGLLIGSVWGYNYYNNNNYYYYNTPSGTTTNTYYSNHWQGSNGSAGYYAGPNGGAYHWNYNGYSGGGYCYQGNCAHSNNWNGGSTNSTTITTRHAEGANGSATSHTSSNGNGAYHWNYNGKSGGGYCYNGNCGHTNNWNGNANNGSVTHTTGTHGAATTGNNGGAYHWNYNGNSGGGHCYNGNCGHTNTINNNATHNTSSTNTATQSAPKAYNRSKSQVQTTEPKRPAKVFEQQQPSSGFGGLNRQSHTQDRGGFRHER